MARECDGHGGQGFGVGGAEPGPVVHEGLALGKSQIDEQAAQWRALLSQLASPLKQLDQQVEQQLLWLAMTLSKVLIKHEVHTSADLLLGSLKEAVKQLPCAEEGVTIELHPDDLALVVKAYGGCHLLRCWNSAHCFIRWCFNSVNCTSAIDPPMVGRSFVTRILPWSRV